MKSRTKFNVDNDTIVRLFQKAGIEVAKNITPLGAGEFNSVYSVEAGEKEYAIKIAPLLSKKILTYEHDMLRQEVYYYSLMAEQAKINVPEVYYSDFSKSDIPTEYFIMEKLPGTQLDQAELTEEQKDEAEQKLAEMIAKMHSVKGEKFGYRQNELFDNWYLALRSMVMNLIQDCKHLGRNTRRGKILLDYIDQHRAVLEKVESSLINFDIWPPNIFCNFKNGEMELAWIDPERCLWGDRIADFVCLDFMNMTLDSKKAAVERYNQVTEDPISIGKEESIRLAIMLGYLGLIMEVEKYARYTLFHFGHWRNVMVSNMLYKSCFSQLEALTA